MLAEPIYAPLDLIGKLTDREKWHWYIKPNLERAKRMKEKVHGKEFEPVTEQEAIFALSLLGVAIPPDVRDKANGESSRRPSEGTEAGGKGP